MEYDRGQTTFSCPNGFQRLMSSRYDGGWSGPLLLDETDSVLGDFEGLSVSADAGGGFLVAYVKTRSIDERGVFALRYLPGHGWQRPEQVGGMGWRPVLAADADGNALVAWYGADRALHARVFDARTGAWAPEQDVPGTSGAGIESYSVAMGGPRRGVLAWTFTPGEEGGNVMVSVLVDGLWGEPRSLHPAGDRAVGRPALAMDPAGNAIAAWAEYEGTNESIWANRFEAAR
jgi:hypothetical protein